MTDAADRGDPLAQRHDDRTPTPACRAPTTTNSAPGNPGALSQSVFVWSLPPFVARLPHHQCGTALRRSGTVTRPQGLDLGGQFTHPLL